MISKIQILHDKDDNGNNVVKVPLSNTNNYATISELDFNDLMDLGLSPEWKQGADGIVQARVPGRTNLSVARLITDASTQRVSYLNGDKTDLRRGNLVLDGNGLRARVRARDLVIPTPRLKRVEVEHVYKHGQTGGTNARGAM